MSRMIFRSPIEKERGDAGSSTSSSSSATLLLPLCHFERRLRISERPEEAFRFTECGGSVTPAAAICWGAAANCERSQATTVRNTQLVGRGALQLCTSYPATPDILGS